MLRTIVSVLQPSASAPSFIRCCGPFSSEQAPVALMRSSTASRWRSNSGPSTPSSPCSRAHCSRTQGRVRRQLVQLIVVPPPSVVPATRLTLPSAVGLGPPRQNIRW